MCVIVTAEKGSMPTIDQLTRMSETNPDGAGIAWHDGNGLHRIRHSDNGKTLAFITEHWNELKATPCLIHFRLATHGAVNTENTHPFRYTLGNDEHGYIAHNGIAQKHTNGRYASDSRNAILAWQTGQTDLTDGTQGKFAKIDQNGRIQWLTPPQHDTDVSVPADSRTLFRWNRFHLPIHPRRYCSNHGYCWISAARSTAFLPYRS